MVRSVNFTVDEKLHVSPSSPQAAGVQGDDGATKVYFVLPSDDKLSGFRSYDFYLEMVDAAGNYDISDKLTVGTDGKVGYALPAAWTQCGGLIQLRLVAKSGNEIAYTFAGQITVAKRAAAKLTLLPKFKEMVLTTIEKCKEAIAASASAVSSAAIAAESAKETQDFAADAAGNRNVAEQSATAAEQSATAAEQSATAAEQSATAAETAASNAESAKSAAESAGQTVVGYLKSTAGSKEAAAASAAAAEERAASAAVSATDAAQYTEAAKTASAAAAEDAAAAANSATAAGQSAAAAAASAASAAALKGKAWVKIAEGTLETDGSIVKTHTKNFNAFDLQISTLDVSAENLKTGTVVLWAYSKTTGVDKSVSVRFQNLSGSVPSRTLRLRGKLENGVWEIMEYNKLKNWQETTAAVNTLANDSTELTDPLYQLAVNIYGVDFPAGTKYALYVKEVDEQ